jgi:hypothetical protein
MGRALLLLAAAALALGACDQPADTPTAPAPGPPPAAAAGSWAFGLGANSVEISYFDAPRAPRPRLRLVCAAGDGFLVLATDLAPVASEERLTIGAGGIAHVLVASPAESGVKAVGPIDDELLSIFDGSDAIRINHGAQNIGPFEPPPAVRRVFAENCRKLRAKGQV